MARQQVEQVRCDRCKRVELLPISNTTKEPDFYAKLLDKELQYEDLCLKCKETLINLWKDLQEWEREIKQVFGPTVETNQAAPLSVAPDYKPPKPHSNAALKR